MLKSRNSDVLIQRSSIDYDTLVYQIPQNYIIESVPPGKTITTCFGEYSFSVMIKEKEIIYTRKFLINQGRYNPAEYKNLYDFILAVSKADNIKLMLTKKI